MSNHSRRPASVSGDERALLEKLRAGDHDAFDQLYHAHKHTVFLKLKRIVQVQTAVEELHQDIFLKIWEQRGKLKTDVPFRNTLLRIARNAAVDFYWRTVRDRDMLERLVQSSTELADPVGEQIDLVESTESLESAIARLPAQRQRIFVYCKIEGNSYAAAAEHFGVSLGTVKDHMAKAMRFLKIEIGRQEGVPVLFLSILFPLESLFP